MTADMGILLGLLGFAVFAFSTERITPDVTGLVLLVSLYGFGLVGSAEVVAGFGNEVVLFLGSLFVVTEGLNRTGALRQVERLVHARVANRPRRLMLALVGVSGVLSAFLSNTATVASLLPLAVALSRRLDLAPSRVLMPLAFGSILGGTCTLIGTSTNIVVSGMLPHFGLERLSLFELAPVGLPLLVLGVAYLVLVGWRLLPDRAAETHSAYKVRAYLGEVVVPPGSPWDGLTIREADVRGRLELTIIGEVVDDGIRTVTASHRLSAGQHLLASGSPDALLRLKEHGELRLVGDEQPFGTLRGRLVLHELVVTPRSALLGQSLGDLDFQARFGLAVLAIYRRGESLETGLARVELRAGDLLLVQGDPAPLRGALEGGDLLLLEHRVFQPRDLRAWLATALFVGMIVVGGLGWAPFSMAAVAAATLMVLFGCLRASEAYAAISWQVLVLVACMLVFASAMEGTGTAAFLAARIVEGVQAFGRDGAGPHLLLGAFYVLTVALTQPMSNQAAALVVLPLAVRAAADLGLEPRPFAVAVCLAASCSFITPLEPASLLVYGPGQYRFRDYFKVGLPLTLLALVITLLLVPVVWPLQ